MIIPLDNKVLHVTVNIKITKRKVDIVSVDGLISVMSPYPTRNKDLNQNRKHVR